MCVCVWGGGIYFSFCFTFATDMKRFQTIVVSCLPDLKKKKKKRVVSESTIWKYF